MLDDLADRHHLELGQRILRAHHQHQLVAENRLDLQARRLDGQGQNADLDRPVLQLFHDLVAEISIDADLHRRIAPAVFPENLRQNIQAGGLVGAHAQRAAGRAAVVRHRHQRFFAQIFQPLGIFVKNLAGRSQLYRLAGAVEQAVAILLLQLADLRADRRLRAENLLPRTGKTALSGHFQKRNELIEVHVVERDYSELTVNSRLITRNPPRLNPP